MSLIEYVGEQKKKTLYKKKLMKLFEITYLTYVNKDL